MISKVRAHLRRLSQGDAGGVFLGMYTLAIGAGLARIVGIASIPILTRLYSPSDYGVLAVYISIVTVLVPILTFRYVSAIPLPKTDVIAFNLFMLCATLIVFGTFLVAFILGVFGDTVLGWFSMDKLAPYWWLIALGVMGTASYELFSMWATRKKNYKVIAKTQFSQSLLGNLVKVGLGLIALKPLGLIIGQIVAQSGGIGGYIKNLFKDFKKLYPLVTSKKLKLLAGHFQDFPKYRLPSQFLMVLSNQAPVLMMAALYNASSTGQLSLAIIALALPVNLIGGAVSKAYYAEVAAIGKRNIGKIQELTMNVQKKLFAFALPLTVLLIITAQPIFSIVFGSQWETAGLYAAILAPYILLQFTSSPLVHALNVVGPQLHFLALNIIRILGLGLLFFFLNVHPVSPLVFIYYLSGFLSCYYLIQTAFVFKTIKY